ncbi:MAG: DNA gyrase subunit A [Paracoccaceae bacterium]
MTFVAEAMLGGSTSAVDRPNYDGRAEGPVVLPATFLYLLANGAAGIAVGMATSPFRRTASPNWSTPVCTSSGRRTRDDTLLNYIPRPDFPTGEVIVDDRETIAQAHRTGRGAFRLRARSKSRIGRGQWQIVVTEIPTRCEVEAIREDRRGDPDPEGADPGGCARRERGRHPRGAGAALEERRPRCSGNDVPQLGASRRGLASTSTS